VQAVHLICRLGYCRVAQSIGLVNTGPDQVSEPKEVENFTQRTSTDTLGRYTGLQYPGSEGVKKQGAPAACSCVSQWLRDSFHRASHP
jgi:hypothetical protein